MLNKTLRLTIVITFIITSMAWFAPVLASDPLVKLEVISPVPAKKKGVPAKKKGKNSNPEAKSIQHRAGWPLTLQLTIQEDDFLGIGAFGDPFTDVHSTFGEINQGAAIVFDDPDGLYSPPPNNAFPPDETLLTFFPDREIRGVNDETGFLTQQLALQDPAGRPAYGGPSLYGERFGEGLVIKDGWGWGADDDLPGLVILSNVGPSLVLKDVNFGGQFVPGEPGFGDKVIPAQTRNSAGFMTMVAYELTSARGDTRITASMLVPRHLYSHTRMIDLCTDPVILSEGDGSIESCLGTPRHKIDGGIEMDFDPADIGWVDFRSEVELRAFVVAPHVPRPYYLGRPYEAINVLEDMNNDGKVTAADAEEAGYIVLSNEVVIEFTQILNSNGQCNGSDTPGGGYEINGRETDVYVDLDGNGYSGPFASFCPGGSGGTTRPPRD